MQADVLTISKPFKMINIEMRMRTGTLPVPIKLANNKTFPVPVKLAIYFKVDKRKIRDFVPVKFQLFVPVSPYTSAIFRFLPVKTSSIPSVNCISMNEIRSSLE